MCGLTGFHRRNGRPETEAVTIRLMSTAQQHRGPDDSGHIGMDSQTGWTQELRQGEHESFSQPVDLLFGFRRLSILDLSENGHQPMKSPDGRVVLMLNGEIYNAFDFTAELEASGCRFRGKSDTEVVLNLYLTYGLEGMLGRLNGMFAIAIYDANLGKLFLARDRFGIKPLYLLDSDKFFGFSSELKSFGHLPGYRFSLDPEGLSEFLLFRNNHENTLLKNITQLSPGHVLAYDPAAGTWTSDSYPTSNNMQAIETAADFEQCLEAAVKSQMISDVPLGCQLSGGVDSSLVTAFATRASPGNMHTISILFDEARYSEAPYIEQVEKILDVEGHRFTLSDDYYRTKLDAATWHLEQPISHPNTIGVMLISEQARQFVTVLLSGEGADELLAGYARFLALLQPWGRSFLGRLRNAAGSRLDLINAYRDPAWRAATASAFCQPDMVKAIYPAFDKHCALSRRMELYSALPGDPLTRQRRYEMATYLPDLLLRQDKMSMANSIENRVPFLDNDLVDSAFSLNSGQLVGRQSGKVHGKLILKQICERIFGHSFTYREKSGFGIPLRSFMSQPSFQTHLQQSIVPGIEARGVFDVAPIRKTVDDLANANSIDIELLWTMVSFETWAQRFLDGHFAQYGPA